MKKISLFLIAMLLTFNFTVRAELFDRLTTESETVVKIPVHAFSVALRELTRGAITKAQIVNAFSLSASEETQLNAIISHYQGLPNSSKADYVVKIHDVLILSEAGFYNETKAKSELGFS